MEATVRQRIATAVHRERTRLGWSAAELARRAGISKASMSQLESGAGNPSVETLWALGVALGVPFSALVDTGTVGPVVIRADDAPTIDAARSAYSASLLSACPTGARRDLYLIRADPGEPRRSDPHQAGTLEHVVIVSGSAEVGPLDDAQRLHPGDYASYAGDVAHVFCALESHTVAVLVSELR